VEPRPRGLLVHQNKDRRPLEQLASVVSNLEAQLSGAPGPLVAALPQHQLRPEEAVGLPGPATAPPDPTVTSKPTLLPGNIAEATRPYWQGRPEDEHKVIPVLPSAYSTDMSAADIQSVLNWMRYQRDDMSRYLLEWIDRWRQNHYSAEATLEMVADMLRNMQR